LVADQEIGVSQAVWIYRAGFRASADLALSFYTKARSRIMSITFSRQGMLVVISAPSGCGKSSILRGVLSRLENARYSISATSRAPRGDEVDGREYYFISRAEFERRIENREFLEYAEVHGHFYGTPMAPINNLIAQGIDVLLDIDVQGGLQVRSLAPESVLVFIAPPDMQVLETRLRGRSTDSEETIQLRLKNAVGEMAIWPQYDYLVTNDDLDEAIGRVEMIIRSERLRTRRLTLLAE